jgi:hypothetical protein
MCDWSSWQFLCEGRYDILLAVLTGAALLGAVTMMLITFFGNRRRARQRYDVDCDPSHAALLRGDGKFSRKSK